jgi:putative phage-type endonuclease
MHKAKTLVSTVGMAESDWLAWRQRGIGGSDVAAICGISPYKSAIQVYLEKLGLAEDQEENQAMRWGKLLEPVIADEFSRQTGLPVVPVNAILQHPEYDWALANVDRLIVADGLSAGPEGLMVPGDTGILEVKNTSAYLAKAWEEGEVPQYYITQLQWYLWVLGLQWGYFAPLIGGNKLLTDKRMDIDLELVEPMLKICGDFWQMVQLRTPPAPDGGAASTEALKMLYPHAKAGSIVALADVSEDDIRELERLKEELKEFERAKQYEIDAIANRIKAELKDAEVGTIGGRPVVSFKETHRAAYTVAANSYRTLRIIKPKKEK